MSLIWLDILICMHSAVDHTATGGASEEEVLRVAAAAERTTRHPVADALLNAAEQRGVCGDSRGFSPVQ